MFRKTPRPRATFREAGIAYQSSSSRAAALSMTPNSRLDLPQADGEPQTTAVAYSLFRRDFVCDASADGPEAIRGVAASRRLGRREPRQVVNGSTRRRSRRGTAQRQWCRRSSEGLRDGLDQQRLRRGAGAAGELPR
jgi:hypothetical protein